MHIGNEPWKGCLEAALRPGYLSMKKMLRWGTKAAGRFAWVDGVTEEDLKELAPADATKVRLLKLARALDKGIAPKVSQRRRIGPARRVGAGGRGPRRGHVKLDRHGAEWIRAWAAAGYSQRAIASAFNVSQPVVSGIVSGQRWRIT